MPRNYVHRTFDMKGSEFDREVIGKKKVKDLSKSTLKDIDFFKTEERIWVDHTLAECKIFSIKY